MVKLNDIMFDNKNPNFYSLKKLLGQDLKDIEFFLTKNNGEVTMVITNLILEDGKRLGFEGNDEAGLAYLIDYNSNVKNFDEDTLNNLWDEYEDL
jgi:hypothetical protein